MNKYFLIAVLLLSTSVFATPVSGEIFYKLPDGNLVKRNVTLEVPARGQGEVILSGDNFEWKTTKFWTKKIIGQTLFIAAFKAEFHDMKATIVFKGTYLKGDNEIIYYGDFYNKSGHAALNKELLGFTHAGGFHFNYLR